MIVPALLCAVGLPAGFLLIRRVPACPAAQSHDAISLSIVIPARNEEDNLPRLLQSIAVSAVRPTEILVVDDASTDNTAAIAQKSWRDSDHVRSATRRMDGKDVGVSSGSAARHRR